ncbi:hypothetical protein [Microbacterium halotolerans]|uniref:hypothetical protein n=1 Tax=Microbacterium halotolerans TaxID=246613 RepID=UPI0013C2D9F7|nr:hypothetical protein [Microbacterium halotolerans]
MEIAAFVVAVVAAGAATVMAFLAHGANKRAQEALDHERRLDERHREFRDVSWHGKLARGDGRQPEFRLKNTGLTEAQDVVLLIVLLRDGTVRADFPRVGAGEVVRVSLVGKGTELALEEQLHDGESPYRVHWASPKGHVDDRRFDGTSYFGEA